MATMLVLALTMIGSVSYAWYTLSQSPEAVGVTTQVASNGNLEVALAGRYDAEGNLLEPSASGIGDSFSSSGQSIMDANITWGNLINLRENYGIESLTLRPATFVEGTDAFLISMTYDEDGRVISTTDKFDFTSWTQVTDGYKFMIPATPKFGVRAITSMIVEETDIQKKMEDADKYHRDAWLAYKDDIVRNESYITAIEGLVQLYLNANVDAFLNNEPMVDSNCTDYIEALCDMMHTFYDRVVCNYGKALMGLANAQLYLQDPLSYTPYTFEEFVASSTDELKARGVTLSNTWVEFQTLYNTTLADLAQLDAEKKEFDDSRDPVMWSEIEDTIDHLIDIDTVQIVDKNGNRNTVAQVMAKGSGVIDWATSQLDSNNVPIIINNGQLRRFEYMAGGYNMKAGIKFYVRVVITLNYKAVLQTNLYGTTYTPLYYMDQKATEDMAKDDTLQGTGAKTADNTYGMVLDLWVRTNAANSILMLDGMAQVETYYELQKIVLSGEAESRQTFLYTYYTGETIQQGDTSIAEQAKMQIYQVPYDFDGDGIEERVYQMTLNHQTVDVIIYEGYFYSTSEYDHVYLLNDKGEPALDSNGDPIPLTSEHFWDSTTTIEPETYSYEVVTGFSSSNRVDEGYTEDLDPGYISATQGSGSCYIFYATPEEATATLNLLASLKLVFCDSNKRKLATAELDVEHVYADSGKYVVPFVITETNATYTDVSGKTYNGICELEQNVATLISVVVYLDGTEVENSMVMEQDEIQGSMNIQFASSALLVSKEDSELAEQTFTLSAGIEKDAMTFNPKDLNDSTTKLSAVVSDINPTSVQAIFRRQITGSQGATMAPVVLDNISGGQWEKNVTFTMPGTYVLRSLWVDGVEYPLPESSWITVRVTGFTVQKVTFCEVETNVALTADNYVDRNISLEFTLSEQVETAAVRFMSDEGEYVAATLERSADQQDTWTGTVRFRKSGHYVLTHALVNGEYYDLTENFPREFTAYLGLRVKVYLQSDVGLNFPYDGPQTVKVLAEIFTDSGETMKNQANVKLYYHKRGSEEDASGLTTDLTWKNGFYEGTFNVTSVGVYNFDRMTVGTNVIRQEISAPTVSSFSTHSPEYQSGIAIYDGNRIQNEGIILVPDTKKNIEFLVELRETSGASQIIAVFKDPNNVERKIIVGDQKKDEETDGRIVEVDGVSRVYFILPRLENEAVAGGVWKLEAIQIVDVYDSSANFYDKDNPYVLDATNVGGGQLPFQFTVVNKLSHTVTAQVPGVDNATSVSLGNTTSTQFMAEQLFKDANGELVFSFTGTGVTLDRYALPESGGPDGGLAVSKVVLKLQYVKGSSQTHGFYSFDDTAKSQEIISIDLVKQIDAQGKVTWILPDNAKFTVAGAYKYALEVTLDVDYDIQEGAPNTFMEQTFTISGGETQILHVYSAKPTVTVTGVSPTGANHNIYTGTRASDGSVSADAYISGDFNAILDNSFGAVVYIYGGDSFLYNVYLPKVTLQLSGMPTSGFEASFAFGNDSDSSHPASYTFTQNNQEVSADVGYAENGSWIVVELAKPKIFPAGKQSVDKMTVDYGGVTYTIQLSHEVTINQPQYPLYVDFTDITSIDGTFTGNTPSRIYGTPKADGTFEVTLPTVDDAWVETKRYADTSSLVEKLDGVSPDRTDTIYWAYKYKGTSFTNWSADWYTYTVSRNIYEATTTASEWTVTNRVVGWTDGKNTYRPGQTITITGATTLRAVIEETHNQDTVTITTSMIRIVIVSVVKGDDLNTNNPDSKYIQVGSNVTPGNPNTYPSGYPVDTGWVIDD